MISHQRCKILSRSLLILTACSFLLALIAAGCAPKNSPRGVVDRFIDAYYVQIDLKNAEQFTAGLALDKIRKEEQLTAGQTIDSSTRKPVVHYRLKNERIESEHATYLFLARIDVPDGGSFDRNWMISARKEGPDWKVSSFSEDE